MKFALVMLFLLAAMMAQTPPTKPPTPPAPRAEPLDALVADSPFLPTSGPRNAAAGSTGPLELRSVVFMDGAYQFSIFDQGTKEAQWVRIGERDQPFVARSYNRERDSLTVEHQGRTLVLALQPSKMASGAPAQPQAQAPLPGPGDPANRRPGQPQGQGGPIPMPGSQATGSPPLPSGATNAAEAQRLQNLADEIRRRRGARPLQLPKN